MAPPIRPVSFSWSASVYEIPSRGSERLYIERFHQYYRPLPRGRRSDVLLVTEPRASAHDPHKSHSPENFARSKPVRDKRWKMGPSGKRRPGKPHGWVVAISDFGRAAAPNRRS